MNSNTNQKTQKMKPTKAPYKNFTIHDWRSWNDQQAPPKKLGYIVYDDSNDDMFVEYKGCVNKGKHMDRLILKYRDSFHFYTPNEALNIYKILINKNSSFINISDIIRQDPNFDRTKMNKEGRFVGRKTMLQRCIEVRINIAMHLGFNCDDIILMDIAGCNFVLEYKYNDYHAKTGKSIRDVKYEIKSIVVSPSNKIHKKYADMVKNGKLLKFDYNTYKRVNDIRVMSVMFKKDSITVDGKDFYVRNKFTKTDRLSMEKSIKISTKEIDYIKCVKADRIKKYTNNPKQYRFIKGKLRMIEHKNKVYCAMLVPGYNKGQWYVDELTQLTRIVLDKCSISLVDLSMKEYTRIFGKDREYKALPMNIKDALKRNKTNGNEYKQSMSYSAPQMHGNYLNPTPSSLSSSSVPVQQIPSYPPVSLPVQHNVFLVMSPMNNNMSNGMNNPCFSYSFPTQPMPMTNMTMNPLLSMPTMPSLNPFLPGTTFNTCIPTSFNPGLSGPINTGLPGATTFNAGLTGLLNPLDLNNIPTLPNLKNVNNTKM